MSAGTLSLVLTAAGIILAQVLALWRIHFAQIRRMDEVQRNMIQRIDEVQRNMIQRMDGIQRDMSQRIDQTSEELRAGQQALGKAVARLDSRISRLEGVILPKPWETPKESPLA